MDALWCPMKKYWCMHKK